MLPSVSDQFEINDRLPRKRLQVEYFDDCEKNQRAAINARILDAIGASRRLDAVNRLLDGVEIQHCAP